MSVCFEGRDIGDSRIFLITGNKRIQTCELHLMLLGCIRFSYKTGLPRNHCVDYGDQRNFFNMINKEMPFLGQKGEYNNNLFLSMLARLFRS